MDQPRKRPRLMTPLEGDVEDGNGSILAPVESHNAHARHDSFDFTHRRKDSRHLHGAHGAQAGEQDLDSRNVLVEAELQARMASPQVGAPPPNNAVVPTIPASVSSALPTIVSDISSALQSAMPASGNSMTSGDGNSSRATSTGSVPPSAANLTSTAPSTTSAVPVTSLSAMNSTMLSTSLSSSMSSSPISITTSAVIPSSFSNSSTSFSSMLSSTGSVSSTISSLSSSFSITSSSTYPSFTPTSSPSFVSSGFASSVSSSAASSSSAGAASAPLSQDSDNGGGSPTPKVVGGVVGGVAGLSVLLIVALMFLRWYKKRRNVALGMIGAGGEGGPNAPSVQRDMAQVDAAPVSSAVPPPETADSAAAAAAATSTAAGTGVFTRRLSRAKQTQPPSETGFQRLSGRKLPSQFSPGMEGPTAVAAASGAKYPSGAPSAHYPSGGTYTSVGSSNDPFQDPRASVQSQNTIGAAMSTDGNGPADRERFMSGPVRTPLVNRGDNARTSHMGAILSSSPPDRGSVTPNRPGLMRSPASHDSNRTSRFQEDV